MRKPTAAADIPDWAHSLSCGYSHRDPVNSHLYETGPAIRHLMCPCWASFIFFAP